MELWKNATCGTCVYSEDAPRPGVPDLKAPKILICREAPPQIVFAIGQSGNNQPVPIPMGSMYPMVQAEFPACSKHKPVNSQSTSFGIDPNRGTINKGD